MNKENASKSYRTLLQFNQPFNALTPTVGLQATHPANSTPPIISKLNFGGFSRTWSK